MGPEARGVKSKFQGEVQEWPRSKAQEGGRARWMNRSAPGRRSTKRVRKAHQQWTPTDLQRTSSAWVISTHLLQCFMFFSMFYNDFKQWLQKMLKAISASTTSVQRSQCWHGQSAETKRHLIEIAGSWASSEADPPKMTPGAEKLQVPSQNRWKRPEIRHPAVSKPFLLKWGKED